MQEKRVIIEICDKHVHLSKQHLAILFGESYRLAPQKTLSQPGLYICKEVVDIEGPLGIIKEKLKGLSLNDIFLFLFEFSRIFSFVIFI
jgi:propanediol utilization protein